MSGNPARRSAISEVINKAALGSTVPFAESPTSTLFGENVFSLAVMQRRLPKAVYKSLKATIESGSKLDASTADAVATEMKSWALEKGATHYAHVFYPLTGLTAEKHDSFFNPDGLGGTIAEFEGKTLIQGEPDGSSFPSGGIRQTFEARGYTIWDVTSPAYILENPNGTTLCIPTAFVSWTGEALDKKTPVLRSMQALNTQAQRVLKLFGTSGAFVSSTAGPEQEYFLIDKNFFYARPDLINAGRTLFGAAPPKGQEFEDHYFGAIPERVLACMFEVERECFKLGIPVKTRHNEVAPAQYELAPVFEFANLATDHQQLIMVTLKRVAEKYGMVCLLHEKPFVGVNGSGKHLNYSMGSSIAGNLFDPGDTPAENAQFLVFCMAMIRATYKWSKLLRSVVATASNDHRLGANETPPAIISVFLGAELTEIVESIAEGKPVKSKKDVLHVGVDVLPPIPRHSGDRNRTSPMAFTGNRFEFRAVGSSQSIAGPLVALNTIMAESLDYCAGFLESADTSTQAKLGKTVEELVKTVYAECKAVVFNGDGYSDAWHKEAGKRGLPNMKTTPDALPVIKSDEVIALFEKYKVLSRRETESRYEVYAEQYVKTIKVEANLMLEIAKTIIFPAAIRYQGELAISLANLKAVGIETDADTLKYITKLIADLQAAIKKLAEVKAGVPGEAHDACDYCRDTIVPAMQAMRAIVDELEGLVADDLWPLPTYQEMLFIK
ncbi:MAG: glutamine synthetase III [Candidatus Hydrogenedentes bacterium]|nr:glutamine synthetase III [Candidatus Hydrogenedentota bacterium]